MVCILGGDHDGDILIQDRVTKAFIIVSWAAVASSFALKSSTHLVVMLASANKRSSGKSNLSQLALERKTESPGVIHWASTSVFLTGSPNSCGVGGVHRVDLAMAIRAAAVVVAIEAVLDIVTVLVVQTVMAIVTVLAIETTFIFPKLNRVSNIRNSLQGGFLSPSHRSGGCRDCH